VTRDDASPRDGDCLDIDDVAAFLHARLEPDRVRALDHHVAGCGACRELLSVLAHGAPAMPDVDPAAGAGAVYTARSPELDREVARKILRHRERSPGERGLTRDLVRRDAQAAAELADPGGAALHDVGILEGHLFLAIELIEGRTLAAWLAAEPRDWRAVLATFVAAGEALAAQHAARAVRRGFAPADVIVGDDGRVRVGGRGAERGAEPEDAREDQRRLCAALQAAIAAQSRPRWLRRALRRGLAAAPEDRYPSMAALVGALRRDPRRRRVRAAIVGLALAAAAAAGAMLAAS